MLEGNTSQIIAVAQQFKLWYSEQNPGGGDFQTLCGSAACDKYRSDFMNLLMGDVANCDVLQIVYDGFPLGGNWKGWQDYSMSRYSFLTTVANLAVIVDSGYQ